MRTELERHGIYLTYKQVKELSKLIRKEDVWKFASIVKTLNATPNVSTMLNIDELTWRVYNVEGANRRVSPKMVAYDVLIEGARKFDPDYNEIAPILKVLRLRGE